MMRMYGGEVQRLPRRKVLIRALMDSGGPATDVCIRDVSSRGLLLQAETPPPRGTFVEIVCEGVPLAGQVLWIKDRRFGVTTREVIDVDRFVDRFCRVSETGGARASCDGSGTPTSVAPGADRSRSHDDSRRTSSIVQFVAVVMACGGVALGLAFMLHDSLTQAFQTISARL